MKRLDEITKTNMQLSDPCTALELYRKKHWSHVLINGTITN